MGFGHLNFRLIILRRPYQIISKFPDHGAHFIILQRNGRCPLVVKNRGSALFETFSFLKYRACLYKAASNRDSNGVGLQSELTGPGGGDPRSYPRLGRRRGGARRRREGGAGTQLWQAGTRMASRRRRILTAAAGDASHRRWSAVDPPPSSTAPVVASPPKPPSEPPPKPPPPQPAAPGCPPRCAPRP